MADEELEFYKGDDFGAFGNNFITVNLTNEYNYAISKAQFVVNGGVPYIEPVNNPVFPFVVNLGSEQTAQLRADNIGKLIVWDSQGRQKTCKGQIEFTCKNGVIGNVRRNCC